MKKRTYSTMLIGVIVSVLVMVIGVASMIIENYMLFGGIALFLAGTLSLSGTLMGYLYHDRFGGVIVIGSTLLYYFALLILNSYAAHFYFYQALWLNGLILMCSAFIWLTGILLLYRLDVNGIKFDNRIFGSRLPKNILTIITSIATIITSSIVIVQQLSVGFIISSIALLLAIGYLGAGLLIGVIYHTRLGSLLMSSSIWFVLSVIVIEINATNVGIIFYLLTLVLFIVTIISEWCGSIKAGEEVHIGPKPYRGN